MAVANKSFSFDDAVAYLLMSNGVTLDRAIHGKTIFDTMSSGMTWTVSNTECKIKENEIEKTCATLAKAKRWPSSVLKEVKNITASNTEGIYVCSGGCTEGRNNGLLVFLTVAYKEGDQINLLVITSDQNVTIGPEEIQNIVTTVQPIVATGKWTIKVGPVQYEHKYKQKIGENISTHVETERKERRLTQNDSAALTDFCLAKICQKFMGRQRCESFVGPDEIRQILCYDFDAVQTVKEMKSRQKSTTVVQPALEIDPSVPQTLYDESFIRDDSQEPEYHHL